MRWASLRSCLVCLGAGLLFGGLPALAQEPPRPQEDSGPFLSVMTGPLERVESVARELGIPLPQLLRREFIESQMPLIGPGGLRGTGSLGLWVGAHPSGSTKSSRTFFVPVNPDSSPPREPTDPGAMPSSSTDTFERGGVFLRRFDGFVLMGDKKEDLDAADPETVSKGLAAAGVLGEIGLDLERWRAMDPVAFGELMRDKGPNAGKSHSRAFGRALVMRFIANVVKRMHFTLLDAAPASALRLRVALEPLAPGETAPFPKPAFPRESVGRLDVTYSSPETSRWVSGIVELFLASIERDGGFDAAQRSGIRTGQIRALFQKAFEVLFVADSLSVAVEPFEGSVLYHQVNQYRTPGNFTARLNAVLKDFRAAERKSSAPKALWNASTRETLFKVSTYQAGGARITRVLLFEDFTLDFVDSGTSVRFVIARDQERHFPPALLKAPAEGSISSIFAGTVDPGAVVSAFSVVGRSLSPEMAITLDGLRGQRISWETRAEGEAAVVELEVPKPFVQAFHPFEESAKPSESAGASFPARPLQGQHREPCSEDEQAVNGVCWRVFEAHPDACPESSYARDGKCYQPVVTQDL